MECKPTTTVNCSWWDQGNVRFTFEILISKLNEPKCVFSTVCHVEKSIFIFIFLINCRHQRSWKERRCNYTTILTSKWNNTISLLTCWRQSVIDKDKDGLWSTELDPLPHHINKLTNSQISWDKVSASQVKTIENY